jgi:hypothetical protein
MSRRDVWVMTSKQLSRMVQDGLARAEKAVFTAETRIDKNPAAWTQANQRIMPEIQLREKNARHFT